MLDPVASVRAGEARLGVLERREDHVDLAVAVGVHGGLEAGLVDRQDQHVELLLRPRGGNAVATGLVDIRLAQPAGPAR